MLVKVAFREECFMKLGLTVAVIGAGLVVTGAAHAERCTAPGHPSCSISCPGGCGAVYEEPNGPCETFCNDSKAAASTRTGEFNGLSAAQVQRLMSGKKKQ
jgi:hypothetical protein